MSATLLSPIALINRASRSVKPYSARFREGLSEILDRAGPATKIIPGHGPLVDRNAVLAQRDLILAVRGNVLKLVEQGKTLDEAIATHPTAEFDARIPGGTPATAARFVTWVYKEVVANR